VGESQGEKKVSREVKREKRRSKFVRSGGALQQFFRRRFFCRRNDHSDFEILFFRKILSESHTFESFIA
jgi:hypothetical protein